MWFLVRCLGVAVLLLLLPLPGWAGSGTVMMWGSYPQLVLGNFFIGLLEAYAIRRRYNTPLNIWLILLANFFSLIIAFVVLAGGFTRLVGLDFWGLGVDSGWAYTFSLFLGLVVAFIGSVLVEWPFFYGALYLRKQHKRLPALQVSVFAQCVSFGFIIIYLLIMSLVG